MSDRRLYQDALEIYKDCIDRSTCSNCLFQVKTERNSICIVGHPCLWKLDKLNLKEDKNEAVN